MISLSLIGLLVVLLGWLLQLFLMDGSKKIRASFILVYSVGVILLIYDGFSSGLNNLAWANLATLIASLVVLVRLVYR